MRRFGRLQFCATLVGWAIPTCLSAADAVSVQPASSWVRDMGAMNATENAAQGLIRLDIQQSAAGGTVSTYRDIIQRANSSEQLAGIGLVKIDWHPDHGDLIVHHVDIIRDGQVIDVTKTGAKFTVIRREVNLERQFIDGISTATLQVEGLKIGDFLRVSFTVSYKDNALGGHMQLAEGLVAEPIKVARAAYRVIWPHAHPLNWRTMPTNVVPTVSHTGDYDELAITLPLPKQPDRPIAAPLRFTPPLELEASDFASWADVVAAALPLYATKDTIPPSSQLAEQVAKIAAMSTDPKVRAAAALRVVQDDVRYLADGQKEGNYTPQTPTETWTKRYGDCKAKTLLLVAMLRALGIEADAALASLGAGDLIPAHLPAYFPFNHVTTRAAMDGKVYYLEGTSLGTRLADLDSPPDYRYVLPLRRGVTAPEPVPIALASRPQYTFEHEIDASLGIGLPALLKTRVTVRGPLTYVMHQAQSSLEPKKFDEFLDRVLTSGLSQAAIAHRKVTFQDDDATAVVEGEGIKSLGQKITDERQQVVIPSAVGSLALDVDRTRSEWRDIPVAVGVTPPTEVHYRITLPHGGTGFRLDNSDSFSADVAGHRVTQAVSLVMPLIKVDESSRSVAFEIPASSLPEERAKLSRLKAKPLKLVAPADYPPAWKEAHAAFRAGKLGPIEDVFAARIAQAETDDFAAVLARAHFRHYVGNHDGAISDFSTIIAKKPTAQLYLMRAQEYKLVSAEKALADIAAARAIDPASMPATILLTEINNKRGAFDASLSAIDAMMQLVEDKTELLSLKAETLAQAGRAREGVDVLNAANEEKPGNVKLLNGRCWARAIGNIDLAEALKDCTKAIELADHPASILDSRAFAYYRLARYDDAIADDNAALKLVPSEQQSLYVRGLAKLAKGDAEGKVDLAAARELEPDIDAEYKRYGIEIPEPARAK